MNTPELRSERRVAITRHGTLRVGASSAPCLIQNMCSRGFLIQHSDELPVGRIVHLTCELYPERSVECTVQVRHVNADRLGARVIEMSEESQTLCRQFLEEQVALNPAL